MSSEGETCKALVGMKVTEDQMDADQYWWPLGVRWPQSTYGPNLVEVVTEVKVMSGLVSHRSGYIAGFRVQGSGFTGLLIVLCRNWLLVTLSPKKLDTEI